MIDLNNRIFIVGLRTLCYDDEKSCCVREEGALMAFKTAQDAINKLNKIEKEQNENPFCNSKTIRNDEYSLSIEFDHGIFEEWDNRFIPFKLFYYIDILDIGEEGLIPTSPRKYYEEYLSFELPEENDEDSYCINPKYTIEEAKEILQSLTPWVIDWGDDVQEA